MNKKLKLAAVLAAVVNLCAHAQGILEIPTLAVGQPVKVGGQPFSVTEATQARVVLTATPPPAPAPTPAPTPAPVAVNNPVQAAPKGDVYRGCECEAGSTTQSHGSIHQSHYSLHSHHRPSAISQIASGVGQGVGTVANLGIGLPRIALQGGERVVGSLTGAEPVFPSQW
jgi:hypothetical protein